MKSRFLLSLFVLLVGVTVFPTISPAAMTEHNYRGRTYLLYEPADATAPDSKPLLVMLHGCTQTPRAFARATGMNDLADRHDFLVAYPEQTERDNRMRCWNWFRPSDTTRGQGEVAELAGITRRVIAERNVDRDRVYLAGFSAGGGMAPVLAVAYPDLYAAVGIHSGFEYRAARTPKQALGAMNGGAPNPIRQGRKAFRAMGKRARPIPTVVIHGSADTVVEPINGRQATRQAVETIRRATQKRRADSPEHYRLPTEPTRSVNRRAPYTIERHDYRFADGRLAVRYLSVRNLGHAWAGGVSGESYVAPNAPDASERLWQFFDRHTRLAVDARVNTSPVLTLKANRTTLPVGDTLTIRARTSDIDGTVRTIRWKTKGETIGKTRTVQHVFRETGTQKITVTVRDNQGGITSRSLVVTVTGEESSSSLPEL